MAHLLEQDLLAFERRLEAALVAVALDRHAEQVRRALQEGEVVLDELVLRPAVDLENAERPAVALQDDVHRPVNAVLAQDLGRPETLLVSEVVGDHRLAGAQRKSRRRRQVGADAWRCRRRRHASRRRRGPAVRLSAGIYSSTLQNSVRKPSAVRRAVSARSVSNDAPCSALTPSSASISCWRIRCCSARSVTSDAWPAGVGSTTGLSFSFGGHMIERYPLRRAPTSAATALRQGCWAEQTRELDRRSPDPARFGCRIKGLEEGRNGPLRPLHRRSDS